MDYKFDFKAFLSGIIAGALSYWLNGHNETSVMGIHIYVIAVAATSIIAYILVSKFKYDTKLTIQNMVFGFFTAVVIRIIYESVTIESTSTNLAPLDILIIFLIVSVSATLGSKIGEL